MDKCFSQHFFEDPKVNASINQLLECLQAHQAGITAPKPPASDKQVAYESLIKEFQEIRGAPLFFPYISSGLGNGPLVELLDGSIKYDCICGIGVHHFGHSHPEIIKACLHASLSDTVMQGHLMQTQHTFDFSKKLLQLAQKNGSPLKHCFLAATGVLAGENALKLAFQKNHPADRILAFEHNFSGRTITFAQITDKAIYRDGIPSFAKVDYIPFFDHKNPQDSIEKSCQALETFIQRYPKQHAAMFFELIQGEGGFYPGSQDFFQALMDICKKHRIAVLVDEVQTFARTSEPFAFQFFGLDKYVDVVWIGKDTQVCATLYTQDYNPRPGLNAGTFTSATSAIASGSAILTLMQTGNFWGPDGKIQRMHRYVTEKLHALSKKHPQLLKGPFGEGLMIAFQVLDGTPEATKHFLHALFQNGVIAFMAGQLPTRVRLLLPALVITESHIDNIFTIIENTLLQDA